MVFCSKSTPSSPRKARSVSPRRYSGRCSPLKRSQLVDYGSSDLLDIFCYSGCGLTRVPSVGSLPRKDVKILEAMARKREDETVREELADRFNELWRKEAEERKMIEAEVSCEYKRFVADKREWHRSLLQQRQLELDMQQDMERARHARSARERQERSSHLLELLHEERRAVQWWRRTEDAARWRHAAHRRCSQAEEEERRRLDAAAASQRRADAAEMRRRQQLRDVAQRTAITNSISQLESARLQREAAVAELLRREELRADILAKEARARGLARARDHALRSARNMAAYTAALRESLR